MRFQSEMHLIDILEAQIQFSLLNDRLNRVDSSAEAQRVRGTDSCARAKECTVQQVNSTSKSRFDWYHVRIMRGSGHSEVQSLDVSPQTGPLTVGILDAK